MSRTMVLWAPDWPIVAIDVPATTPAAVLDKGQVLACSQAAWAVGVRRGMRRRFALSRGPGLVLHDHNADAEARAFEAVLTAIEELSPGVAPLRPGLCAISVPARFYGGEAEAAAVIAERLVGLGVWDVRAGIADGLFAAEQAARRALAQDSLVVPAGGSGQFLRDLPIDALDDADLVGLLRRMGLLTLGDFASLPAADVHTRFGTHGALLHRLARGDDAQPISRRQVPPEFEATLMLEPPLELVEPIAFSLRTTAEGFVTDLAGHGLVCTTVLIEVDSDGSLATSRRWMHPRWFGATDLIDRVRWQLQVDGAIRAPVDAVRLIPEVTEPLGDHADSLFGGGPDERVERGVARVQSIVGHEAVVSVTVQGGRGPAERRLLTPWGERPVAARAAGLPWPGSLPPPAPATVYAEPRQAMVVGAEGQPIGVTGRGIVTGEPARFRAGASQDWQPVASWAGPWPVDEQWWDEAAARRIARFQVVGVDGSAFLMIVEGGHWWVEACYD
ncbi:MAG: DNA polymerase Y family protein [Aeromicrobium sp.]